MSNAVVQTHPSHEDDLNNRRKTVKGNLVRPRQQLKYAMILVCGGILAQSLVIGAVAFFLHKSVMSITEFHQMDPDVGTHITNAITGALVLVLLVATAVAMGAILIGVKLSHRVYGPMIPFRRHIDELKAGNYASRINLRKNDDLVEMRDALNDLAITLEDRYKPRR